LKAEFTFGAGVFITVNLTVDAFLLPAGFGANRQFGAVHTGGATVQLPAGVKAQIVADCRQVEVFRYQLLNEVQAFEVSLGIEAAAAPTLGLDYPLLLPDADGLGVDIDQPRDNTYGKYRPIIHAV